MKKLFISILLLSPFFLAAQQTRVLNGQYNDGQSFGKPIPDTVRTLVADGVTTSISSGGSSLVDTIKSIGGGSGTPAGSTGYIQYNNAGSFGASANLFWDNTNGWIGIGGTPSFALHIQKNSNSAQRIRITNISNGAAALSLLDAANDQNVAFQEGVSSSGYTPSGLITSNTVFFQSNAASRLVFKAIGVGNATPIIFGVGYDGNTEAMRIFGNGSVNIGGNGTDSTSLLTVNGNINSIQNFSGTAQSYFTNTNTGTGSQVLFRVSNGTYTGFVSMKGTGYATNGLADANTFDVANSGGNKFLIRNVPSAAFPKPSVVFGAGSGGNTEAMRIRYDGTISINSPSDSTAYLVLPAGTTSLSSLKINSGVAPTSPLSGQLWYETTNNRLMFRQNATSVELLGTSSVNTVSPTSPNRTLTVMIGGVNYYIPAKTSND